MQWYELPFALLAFLAVVAVTPVWVWFAWESSFAAALTTEARFLAGLALPAMLLLMLASWVEPRGLP